MGVFILKNILIITMVIIGSIIGAGFASGQEINSFFYKFGIIGIFGMIISIVLISIIIFKVFKIIKKENINTYKEFLNIIFKNKKNNYLNFPYITNIVINIFLIISFFIMIAGFGAYFKQQYNINEVLGSAILAIICLIIFSKNIEGLLKLNKYIIPILIIFMFFIGIKNINNFNLIKINNEKIFINFLISIFSGIIYSSYNIILLIPILITLKNKIEKNKNIFLISFLTGIILFILSLIIYFLLANIKININNIQMPALYSVSTFFPKYKIIYEFIILVSIITTAISEGISILENNCKTKKSYTQFGIILCISGTIFSKIGFSNLIKLLYPIFGILGFFEIFIILKYKIDY